MGTEDSSPEERGMWCGNYRSLLFDARDRNDWSGTSNPPSELTAYIYTDVYTHFIQAFNTATNLETGHRYPPKQTVTHSTMRLKSSGES